MAYQCTKYGIFFTFIQYFSFYSIVFNMNTKKSMKRVLQLIRVYKENTVFVLSCFVLALYTYIIEEFFGKVEISIKIFV